jgi:hypothetical protein
MLSSIVIKRSNFIRNSLSKAPDQINFHQPPMLGYIPNKCPNPLAGGRIKPL